MFFAWNPCRWTPHIIAMNPPITPGEILLEEYLTPMGISQNAMSRAASVLGHRSITPVMSLRFGAFFV